MSDMRYLSVTTETREWLSRMLVYAMWRRQGHVTVWGRRLTWDEEEAYLATGTWPEKPTPQDAPV